MTDKPILKRSTNPSVNTRNRRKYYIELRDYYSKVYDNAKSDLEKAEALESLNATQNKLDTLISNVIAKTPKRKTSAMTDKKEWGGKRPNQTGRPPARPGVRRVGFHCMVDPATRDLIKQYGQSKKLSVGQVVDELADKLPKVNPQG